MEDEDVSYLSPSFDLSSLTIPRLRSILVSHDVPYPASAKKSQLIEIMRSQVLPNAARIIRQRDKIRRTSAGIMNARSNQELLDEEQRAAAGSNDLDNNGHDTSNVPATPATPATAGRKKRTVGSRASAARASSTAESKDDNGSFDTDLNPSLSFSTRKRRSTRQSTIDSDVGDLPAVTATATKTPRKASATPARTPRVSATPSLRSSRRSKSRQSDLISANDLENNEDESTFIAPRTPATARGTRTTNRRETRSSSIAMPDESDMATPRAPTARLSPAISHTPAPVLKSSSTNSLKTPKRSESVFSSDNPFQSGTPYRLEPTNYSQGPATAPVKRPSSSTKLTYYTGSGSSASLTPSLRPRTSTPKIKEEPRTSETPDSVAAANVAASDSSRWSRNRFGQGEDSIIPETDEEVENEEEEEEEEEVEDTTSELDKDDEDDLADDYLGDDTYDLSAMSREVSVSGDQYDDYNPETPQRSPSASLSGSPPPGEEFTPEEQLSLEEEQAANGKWASVDDYHSKTQRRGPPSTTAKLVRFLSWIFILSILSSVGLWYRREKIGIGYCGVGKSEWSLRQYPDVPEWVHTYLEPACEECPPHAYCYPSHEMRCEPSFIQSNHPLSLFGLIPLPATCEPDSEKARRVKNVVEKAIALLREQRAKFECRERGRGGGVVIRPEMTVSELKEVITQLRRGGMSDEEFEDLWRGAVPEIRSKDEVVSSIRGPNDHREPLSKNNHPQQGTTGELELSSTSLSRLSLTCSLRRSFRLTLRAYRLPLFLIGFAIFSILYIRHRILRLRAERASVPMLVNVTLDRLATQAALHARGAATEPWISIAQLRDDVLRDEGRKKRERVWKLVGAVVEQNANVRASVREGRAGDVSRVWEWIGGISGAAGDWWIRSGKETKGEKTKEGVKEEAVEIMPLKEETNGRGTEVKKEEGKPAPKKYENSRPIF